MMVVIILSKSSCSVLVDKRIGMYEENAWMPLEREFSLISFDRRGRSPEVSEVTVSGVLCRKLRTVYNDRRWSGEETLAVMVEGLWDWKRE